MLQRRALQNTYVLTFRACSTLAYGGLVKSKNMTLNLVRITIPLSRSSNGTRPTPPYLVVRSMDLRLQLPRQPPLLQCIYVAITRSAVTRPAARFHSPIHENPLSSSTRSCSPTFALISLRSGQARVLKNFASTPYAVAFLCTACLPD